MPDQVRYEHGARKATLLTGPDPNDEFSQDAATNRKPPLGLGLTERVDKPKDKPREEAQRKPKRPARDTRETPTQHPDDDRDPADTAAVPEPRRRN